MAKLPNFTNDYVYNRYNTGTSFICNLKEKCYYTLHCKDECEIVSEDITTMFKILPFFPKKVKER